MYNIKKQLNDSLKSLEQQQSFFRQVKMQRRRRVARAPHAERSFVRLEDDLRSILWVEDYYFCLRYYEKNHCNQFHPCEYTFF